MKQRNVITTSWTDARFGAAKAALGIAMTALLILATNGALAQERPQTTPSRDVDVVYKITRGAKTLQEQTRWRSAEQAERIDPPGTDMHVIIDHQKHSAWLVNDKAHTVMDLGPPREGPLDPASHATFARHTDTTIAGQSCTDWAILGAGPETVLCLTMDGVLLRVQAGGHTLVEAERVTYAPSDPALFTIPAQYTHTPLQKPPPG